MRIHVPTGTLKILPILIARRRPRLRPKPTSERIYLRERSKVLVGHLTRRAHQGTEQSNGNSSEGAASHPTSSLEGARVPLRKSSERPSALAVFRRSSARRPLHHRGGRPLSRLLQEPHHRGDPQTPAPTGPGIRPAGAHRRHVSRGKDQRHRETGRPARRPARPERRNHRCRWRGRGSRRPRGARQDERLLRPHAQRRMERAHRQAHSQCHQHRHRRLRPRPGDGL